MKVLVTGGNRGLGKVLSEHLNADAISRSNGYDITSDVKKIAELSLQYDVFINNAFDGPAHEPWANFAQVNVLYEVFQLWKDNNKNGWIYNIGSVGERHTTDLSQMFETYRTSKAALSAASRQCTASFKNDLVKFKTTLITLDRLDTDLSRSRDSWTGNGVDCTNVVDFIKFASSIQDNTCIEEIIMYVNFHTK